MYLDGCVGRRGDYTGLGGCILPVHNTQHGGNQIDSEDIVSIGEETNTGHNNGADMVPAEGSLIDLGQGKSSSLIRIRNVGIVLSTISMTTFHDGSESSYIMEIMKGSVASRGLLRHAEGPTADGVKVVGWSLGK